MKNFLVAMLVVMVTLTVGVSTAEARRLGGGGSFGKQSQSIGRQSPSQPFGSRYADGQRGYHHDQHRDKEVFHIGS